MSEEALQIAEKRREAKGKLEKEIYTHLNAEFQRIATRDKKVFSDQCKEIEVSLYMSSPAPPSVSMMVNFCVHLARHITQVKHQSRCCCDFKKFY